MKMLLFIMFGIMVGLTIGSIIQECKGRWPR
jgi:hypothetical protein